MFISTHFTLKNYFCRQDRRSFEIILDFIRLQNSLKTNMKFSNEVIAKLNYISILQSIRDLIKTSTYLLITLLDKI